MIKKTRFKESYAIRFLYSSLNYCQKHHKKVRRKLSPTRQFLFHKFYFNLNIPYRKKKTSSHGFKTLQAFSVSLYIYISIYLNIYLSIYLSIYIFIYQFIDPSIYLHIYIYIYIFYSSLVR